MTESSPSPNWDKLPNAPDEFFELQAGYNQTDLKPAYFRLIKRFKPEKHPQEFQRIRTAYEQLDNQLRYGIQASSFVSDLPQYTWDASPPTSQTQDQGVRRVTSTAESRVDVQPPAARPLYERVAHESPKSLYDELKRMPQKQPFHFYALAVLSDITQNQDSLAFVKWTMAGLKEYPRDPALFQLLHSTIRRSVRWEDIPKLLNAISKVIRDDRFYYLTEPLWDQVLRQAPFQTFRNLLAKCEDNLSDYQLGNKLTFYTHVLKTALWFEDTEWVSKAFELLERHHQELPPRLEYDVEVLYRVREYLQTREQFLKVHPLRRLVDETIRTSCTGSSVEGQNAFLECQVRLATSGTEILAAFPLNDRSDSEQAFYSVWQLLTTEFSDSAFEEGETTGANSGVRQMLGELETKTNGSFAGRKFQLSGLGFVIGPWMTYILIYFLLYLPIDYHLDQNSPSRTWLAAICVILAGLGGWLLNKYYVTALWQRWCLRCAESCYARIWRPELQQFLGRTYCPYRKLLYELSRIDEGDDEHGYFTFVNIFAKRDFGLMMFSNAQRVVF